MTGHDVVRWTIRLSLASLAFTLAIYLSGKIQGNKNARWLRIVRVISWLGCLFFWLHVIAAYHFVHQWNHDHALAHTAKRSLETVGWAFSAGIYFNFAFGIVWMLTTLALIPAHKNPAFTNPSPKNTFRAFPRVIIAIAYGFLFFIAFNGAVIFAKGAIWWWGLAVSIILAILLFHRFYCPKARSFPNM